MAFLSVVMSANCTATEYACASDGRCKPRSTWCDGTTDCTDRSDEPANCGQSLSSFYHSFIFCSPHYNVYFHLFVVSVFVL